jgi:hypothetical protein
MLGRAKEDAATCYTRSQLEESIDQYNHGAFTSPFSVLYHYNNGFSALRLQNTLFVQRK